MDQAFALLDDCSSIGDPARCISPLRLDQLLYNISHGLGGIIQTIRWAYRNTDRLPPIFLNGYDYPVPDGRGVFGQDGGWIKKAMDHAGVHPDLGFRFEIVKHVVDAMNDDVLAALHSPIKRVFHIDARGTLSTDPANYRQDWENELHPTSAGFRKILERAWFPKLQPFGIIRPDETGQASPGQASIGQAGRMAVPANAAMPLTGR